jgi:hypothetical protein
MVLMIPIWNRHGWRVKMHFQQGDGPTLRRQLVAIEIYSNDIITEVTLIACFLQYTL